MTATIASAQAALGTTFAGAWMDNTDSEPVMVVQTVGDIGSASSALAAASGITQYAQAHVRVQKVTFTGPQLEKYQTTLESYLTSIGRQATVTLGISSYDNAIILGVAQSAVTAVPALESLVPRNALRLTVNTNKIEALSGPGWRTNLTRTKAPPYKGGMAAYVPAGSCTTGFLIKVNSSYKGVMAGHCGGNGTQVTGGLGEFGKVFGSQSASGSTGDFSVFGLTTKTISGYIVAETNGSSAYVDAVTGRESTASQDMSGNFICISGDSSGTRGHVTCSTTILWNQTVTYTGKTIHGLTYTGNTGHEGDSGGPMYHVSPGTDTANAQAAGVVDAGVVNGAGEFYTPIERVLSSESSLFSGAPTVVVKSTGGGA
jgi:hypothetical protein